MEARSSLTTGRGQNTDGKVLQLLHVVAMQAKRTASILYRCCVDGQVRVKQKFVQLFDDDS
jgi:hypothetical protein